MTIKVTVEFQTVAEAVAFLQPAMAVPQQDVQAPKPRLRSKPATATVVETPTEAPAPVAAAPKVPNQPVQAIPAPAPTPPEAATVVADSNVRPATAEGVRLALRDVFNSKGAKVATELLKQFGAASISQVKPADYAAFIAAAAK